MYSREVGDRGAAAHVQEDLFCREFVRGHAYGVRSDEVGCAGEDSAAGIIAQPRLNAVARTRYNRLPSSDDRGHIHRNRGAAERHAVLSRATRHLRSICAGNHRLRWSAPGVHTGSAKELSLNEGDGHLGRSEAASERRSGLTRADDDGIEFFHTKWGADRLGKVTKSLARKCL